MNWPNLSEFLKQKARRFGPATLIRDYQGGALFTYEEFDETSDRLAWGLQRLGAGRGDRVAFLHRNHTDLLLGYFAVIKADAVAVPINPAYTPREIQGIIEDSGAKVLISSSEFSERISAIRRQCPRLQTVVLKANGQTLEEALKALAGPLHGIERSGAGAGDPAMIFYTSGTTGKPKGVIITHRNMTFGGANTAQSYGLMPGDVTIICLPLNHIFANATPFLGSLCSGGSAVVMERFQTDQVFDAISRYRVTWFPGVPTMFNYLLTAFDKRKRDVASLRMGLSGAASLSVAHLERFEDLFGASMLEVYGLTESTGLVTANPVFGVRKAGSIGITVSGVSVRLVDEHGREVKTGQVGELIFRGPNATVGYWQSKEQTEKTIRDGWIYTGDMAYQDQEGYFYIAGRKNELIISGGYNIYPREIEEVLMRIPGVAEAAVIGVPDAAKGEVPKAFVVPGPGTALRTEEIAAFCRLNLARYKVPEVVEVRMDLPRNSTGKILKTELIQESKR